ncbi:MAG: hypothetical protein NTX86_00525 [Candidatus Dependentiae bacterium]|nr:hypothetical protein [Candidatus Dependentiae bacterium]
MNNEQITPIPRHSYPKWVMLFMFLLGSFFIVIFCQFLLIEFHQHYKIGKEIKAAEDAFIKGGNELLKSIEIYSGVLECYPECKKAKMRIAESLFIMSKVENSHDIFFDGMLSLVGLKYSKSEFSEVLSYVPKQYQSEFKDNFIGTSTRR